MIDTHAMPSGVVMPFFGAISSIPAGWALCDGNNGTPDLSDKYGIIGTSNEAAKGNTTTNHTNTSNNSHSHSITGVSTANLNMNHVPSHTHGNQGAQPDGYPDGWDDRVGAGDPNSYPRVSDKGLDFSNGHSHGSVVVDNDGHGHAHTISDVSKRQATMLMLHIMKL